MRTDDEDKVIPAAEMAMISVIGSHVNEVYGAGDERDIRSSLVPDDYYSDK